MLLFKCKCGCFLSISDGQIGIEVECQNCKNRFNPYKYTDDLHGFGQALKESGMTMQKIPDDAVLDVQFKL